MLRAVQLAQPASLRKNPPTAGSREEAMGKYRIMLVDDEEEVRSAILKKMDWERQ